VKNTAVVEKKEDIERLLKHGLAPITTNRDALLELGFTQGDPSLSRGYEASIWERSVDYADSGGGDRSRRVMARERAYLVR
jgi:hypothetical protein